MAEPIIHFKDFSFKYRAQVEPTLHDINLDIYPGEKILIVGPSGSGKSTLAHCLNGLVPFAFKGDIKGEYSIKGQTPSELGIFGLSKMVGTVLQDTDGQFIGLTVAEDIAFALENDRVEQQEMFEKVDKVAELVSVKDLLDHAPGELSGGQKQRVAIGGVMVDDVDIMLFDEPLANLDPATGKTAIELIDEIKKSQNATIIIIEHRLEDALYKDVDRILVISEGTIAADMTPDELLCRDVLQSKGIREPLYLTALKHAGCEVKPESHPQHIETMDVEPYKAKLLEWFSEVELPRKKVDTEPILEVRELDFAYTPGKQILQNINFTGNRGEMISIVGKNGAGKTTLLKLIAGELLPTSGQIKFVCREESIDCIGSSQISFVPQESTLFRTTLKENLTLGKNNVREEKIKEVLSELDMWQRIADLPKGLETKIDDEGMFSGGQIRRISIARALLEDKPFIFLDEPFSDIDAKSQEILLRVLRREKRKRGIVIIAHTFDLIEKEDVVISLGGEKND